MRVMELLLSYLKSKPAREQPILPVLPPLPEEDSVVRRGEVSSQVKFLQEMLNRFVKVSLTVDGDYGPATERAVKKAQRKLALFADPQKVTPVFWNVLKSMAFLRENEKLRNVCLEPEKDIVGSNNRTKKALVDSWNQYGGLLAAISRLEGLPPDVVAAIWAIESTENFQKIQFENHIFWKYWGRRHRSLFADHFKFDPSHPDSGHCWRKAPEEPWVVQHVQGQEYEQEVFDFARTLDENSAYYSISVGTYRIHGFNHRKVGYENPQSMLKALGEDTRWHILALFDFIRSDTQMSFALKRGNLQTFASLFKEEADYALQLKSQVALARIMGIR